MMKSVESLRFLVIVPDVVGSIQERSVLRLSSP